MTQAPTTRPGGVRPLAFIGTKAQPNIARGPRLFREWLQHAPSGAWLCYWEGRLGATREAPALRLNADAAIAAQNHAETMGTLAWDAYQARLVHLVQARHPLYGFRYFAVRTSTKL